MLFKDYISNLYEDIKIHLIKYIFIYTPLLGIIIYTISKTHICFEVGDDFISNLTNVSGVLAGFLFTSLGILISLPSNKFISFLKKTGHMRIIHNCIMIGIMAFLITMVLGLFNTSIKLATYLFVVGISETFVSACYMYRVSYYSEKSE